MWLSKHLYKVCNSVTDLFVSKKPKFCVREEEKTNILFQAIWAKMILDRFPPCSAITREFWLRDVRKCTQGCTYQTYTFLELKEGQWSSKEKIPSKRKLWSLISWKIHVVPKRYTDPSSSKTMTRFSATNLITTMQ